MRKQTGRESGRMRLGVQRGTRLFPAFCGGSRADVREVTVKSPSGNENINVSSFANCEADSMRLETLLAK